MSKKTKLINAGIAIDDRGELLYCNDFDMSKIKRFYHITNYLNPFIRAWHGHKIEEKFLIVTNGSALVAAVEIDDWEKPSKDLKIQTFLLNDKNPKILNIPAGYAHGYKTLLPDTRLTIFSSLSLPESQNDDFRYDFDYWDPWTIKER